MDNITGMSIQEYAAMRELECEHKKGWGSTTALWVIAAVIVIAFFVYSWHNSCNERTQFAVGLANLTGRVNCMEPDVRWTGQQLYAANGAISATVQGVGDMKANFGDQLFQLNREVSTTMDTDVEEIGIIAVADVADVSSTSVQPITLLPRRLQ